MLLVILLDPFHLVYHVPFAALQFAVLQVEAGVILLEKGCEQVLGEDSVLDWAGEQLQQLQVFVVRGLFEVFVVLPLVLNMLLDPRLYF